MERVLSIDASTSQIELLLLEVSGSNNSGALDSSPIKLTESISTAIQPDETIGTAIIRASASLTHEWDDTILFLHTPALVALNVTMPFSDQKQISKIIDSEVQDQVPFDTDQFVMSFMHTGSLNGSGEDVHVALCPALTIESLLSELKGTSAEPRIIASPAAGLQGLYEIFSNELEPNATLCIFTDDWVYLAFVIDQKMIAERSLKRGQFAEQMWGTIETAIRGIETRYHRELPVLYRIIEANNLNPDQFTPAQFFTRQIKDLSLANLFPHFSKKVSLTALLGAVLGKEYPAPKSLTNFRKGAFSYRPSMREVIGGMKFLTPYFLGALITLVVVLSGWYIGREYKINSLRSSLQKSILQVVPEFKSLPGQEAITLQALTQNIQDILKDLGSPLAAPPLMVFALISEDFRSIEGVKVTRWSVRNGEIKIDGSAPNYRALNRLEASLKKRKNIFCRIRTDSPSVGGNRDTRDFQMTITLCE